MNLYKTANKFLQYNFFSNFLNTPLVKMKSLSTSSIDQNRFVGEQNKFYFIESKLSQNIKSKELYADTYSKIPVVLVMGWAGAIDKHVQKYSDFYSHLGYHTIRFAPSNSLTFFEFKQHHKYAYELLNILKNEFNLTQNPIVTHFFSNASFFIVYQHIINELKSNKTEYEFFRQNHKALIFDSAPGYPPKGSKIYKGISDLVGLQVKFPPLKHALTIGFLSVVLGYTKLYPQNYFTNAYETYINDPRQVPTLYMYSKIDKLISAEDIKLKIDQRSQKNPNQYLKEVVFDDSEHVLIYQKHPQEYEKLLKEHLKVCKVDMENVFGGNLESLLKPKL